MVLTLSNILTIIVILILIIDIVYRIRHRNAPVAGVSVDKPSMFKEIFRDFKDQLSFTRVATAVTILGIFITIAIGWYWPHLQQYSTTAYDKLLDFAKTLFAVGKSPEAISQLGGIFKPKDPAAGDDK